MTIHIKLEVEIPTGEEAEHLNLYNSFIEYMGQCLGELWEVDELDSYGSNPLVWIEDLIERFKRSHLEALHLAINQGAIKDE